MTVKSLHMSISYNGKEKRVVGGGRKVLFHGIANVRPMNSGSTSITLKVCSGPDVNPFCFLQKMSVEEKQCLMKWLFDFK